VRLLVCGGRDYSDYTKVYTEIARALDWVSSGDEPNDSWLPPKDTVIISGGATGADSIAVDWAVIHWVPREVYKADWERHGKAAGPIRNKRMLVEGKPDMVLAFPGGPGTANMVDQALKAGVPVRCIS
jgi:hypothetical protein